MTVIHGRNGNERHVAPATAAPRRRHRTTWGVGVAVFATVGALVAVPAAGAATNDVTGVVFQPGGTVPAAGITVTAMDANGNSAGAAVMTGADGSFGLSLPNGAAYTVEVSPPNPDPSHWVTNQASVSVPATGSANPLSISMLAATVIGTVTDSSGKTVSGAVLSAESMSTAPVGPAPAGSVAVSDQNGSYGLALPAGSYTLIVSPPQPNTAELVQQNLPLSVGPSGGQVNNVTLPVANVTGTVVDPSGNPVAQTAVQAVSTTSPNAAPVDVGTDGSGTYLFHLDPGSYQITAQPPYDDTGGWVAGSIAVTVGSSGLTGQTLPLKTPALTGRVLTPDGASIVKGAGVEAVATSAAPGTQPAVSAGQSASNGVYGLVLPSGTYSVTVSPPPGSIYATSTTTLTIPAANPTDLRLAVADVTGAVLAPDKTTPVPNAQVLAVDSSGHMTQTITGTDGGYALNLPAGTYEITANDTSGTTLYQQGTLDNVTITDGAQPLTGENVDLVAPDVTGTVTQPDGTTPAGAAVYAYDTTALTWSAPSVTDALGRFGMALTNGTYRLVALANDGSQSQAVSAPLTVTGGAPATASLTFPPPTPPAFDFADVTRAADGSDADGSVSESSMSADASKVAFISNATNLGAADTLVNGQSGAFLYDTASHAITFVGVASDAALSPSGRYLVFVSDDANLPGNSAGNTGVWEEDLAAANPAPVRVDTLPGGPGTVQPGAQPSVSSDGRFVTMTGFNGTGLTGFVADMTKGVVATLTDPNGATTIASPQVSADGSAVAYVAYSPGAATPTYSLDAYAISVGAATTVATMGNGQAVPPFAMSADGATIAYAANGANGAPELHITSAGKDTTAPIFDGFGASSSSGISSIALDTAGDVFFTAASGEAGPNSSPEVWAYHPTQQATSLVSADTGGAPVLLPVQLAGVSADGSHILLTAPGDSFAPGSTFTAETNLFYGVPHQASAPVWPQGSTLAVSGVGSSVATLAWTPISDPFLAGYRIFAGGAQVGQVPAGTTSFVASGLTPSTAYHFQVQAGGTDGMWTTDGPGADTTTLASSQGASAVATVKLLATGAVQVSWPAAAGSPVYRVFRSVNGGAPAALTPDTSSPSLTDHPPASSTVAYTVSTLDGTGNPTPYAVGDQSVSVPALSLRSVNWSGDTMAANGAAYLKNGSTVHVVAVGSPGYAASAVVTYLQTPVAAPATPSVRRLHGGTPMVVLRTPRDVPAQTATKTVGLTEDPANPGTYSGDFALPAGATQLVSIAATIADGAGGTRTATAGQLPAPVAGALAVNVQAPANSLTGGQVSIYGSTTGYSASQAVSGGGTFTLDAPADSYFVSIANGQGSLVYWVSGINVAAGAVTPLAAAPTFPAALTVNVTGSDTGQGLDGVWVTAIDSSTQHYLGSGQTGPDGAAQITGLEVPMTGTQVQLGVSPGQLAYAAPAADPTTTVGIGQNSTQVSLAALPTATVTGTVTNPYGEPDPTATIDASVSVPDGRSWSYSTQTDPTGHYSLQVLAGHLNLNAGSPTGSSQSVSTDVAAGQTLTQNVSMQGNVPYNLQVGIATKALGQSTYTPLPALDWREGVHFNFSVQTDAGTYGYSTLQSAEDGGTAAGVMPIYGHSGEVVKACADGSQAGLSPAQTCSSVTLGLDPNGSSVTVDIDATPWVSATLDTADGRPVTGSWTASLTDESASPPSVVSTISGSGSDLEMPVSAPAGAYHLAVRSGSLAADQTVTVVDATKTDLGTVTMRSSNWFTPDSVPEDNTVTAMPAQALPGDHVSLRAQFQNNGTDIASATAALQKPAGSTIETGSVTLNGQPVTPTQAADGSLTIPVGNLASGKGGVVQYTVDIAPTAQPGSTVGAAIVMSFTAGGSSHTESLQSGAVQLAGVTISAPGVTNQLGMTASGRAPANAPVTVYAGATVMAATTASPGGYWQATLTLPDLGGVHYYSLHAEAAYSNTTLHSPDTGVYFNGSVPVVTKVTMWQDDPGNPNGRKFSYFPANGVPSFPFVWVPGQAFHVQVAFNHPDQVNNVTVQMGGGSTVQAAPLQADRTFLATWTDPDPGDGQILIGFDSVPQPLDLSHLSPQSLPQTRSQLPDGLNDFSTAAPSVDPSDPNTMDFNISLPSFAGGATDQVQLALTASDYTPTQADLDQAKADGISVYGRSVQFDTTNGTMTAVGYVPASVLPSGVTAQLRALRPHGILPTIIKYAIKQGFFEGGTGAELGETALNKAATAAGATLNIGPLGLMNMNYDQLNEMNGWIDNCTDPDERTSLRNQLLNLNKTMLTLDALGAGVGAGFDIMAAATDTFGLLGGPETLGLSTLAAWGLTTLAGAAINAGFNALENANIGPVEDAIRHCKGQRPDIANGGDNPNHHSGGGGSMTPIRDPSGFAYEGVESNRLSNVTTTLLQGPTANGPWTVWNATWFGQQNPLTTDGEGRYAWNVPDGWWKVQFNAPGYQTAFSPPEQVPPPRTGINVGLVSLTPPTLSSAAANTDGTVTATFSQYMQATTVNASDLTLLDGAGKAVAGTVAPANAQNDPSGTSMATTFTFKPTGALPAGQLTMRAAPPAFNYGGNPMAAAATVNVAAAPAGNPSPPGGAVGSPTSGSWQPVGSTYSSSPTPPTRSNPVVVRVTTPVAGDVSAVPVAAPTPPAGYASLGQAEQLTAPQASTSQPLVLSFDVDRSALPPGADDSELTVTRDGAVAGQCLGATTVGAVDPCVSGVVDHGAYVTITVLSTHASTWAEVAAESDRLAGSDRVGTAVAVSQAYFGAGQAPAAVLARSDDYADGLSGGPLAAAKGGPLLLSASDALPSAVAAELTRVLVPGATVYLLGGPAALSAPVEQAVAQLGFKTVRLAGADRYATAVVVAQALGNPTTVLLASGEDFPDALAAGTAAAHTGGAVLLTAGAGQAAATSAYLAQHPGDTLYAIGGPAAQAAPRATPVVGADRYATAVDVAKQFFPGATGAGLATGLGYADALSAGAVLGSQAEPLLLTDPNTLSSETQSYIQSGILQLHVFGGPAAVAFNGGSYLSGAARLSQTGATPERPPARPL